MDKSAIDAMLLSVSEPIATIASPGIFLEKESLRAAL
jgi:hypothetical protein